MPDNPGAWITTTARNHALDRLRRESRRPNKEIAALQETQRVGTADLQLHPVQDDQLRLLFTCCHPALAPATQVALTLREVGGLRTAEIARAFLQSESTVGQRLSRAKRRIRTAGIPFRVPDGDQLTERLPGVLSCIELIYREGYSATGTEQLVRRELCVEGVRLAALLASLMPEQPEALGLAALLQLLDARHATRTTPAGDLVLLEDQDRSLWDHVAIADAVELLDRARARGETGPYQVRAAITAEHAQSPSWETTDWDEIASLYATLAELTPTPIVELNRAIAIAFARSPSAGLAHLSTVADDPHLAGSHHLPATRADLLRRLGRTREAAKDYEAAIVLAPTEAERRYLQKRLDALDERPWIPSVTPQQAR